MNQSFSMGKLKGEFDPRYVYGVESNEMTYTSPTVDVIETTNYDELANISHEA